MWSPLAGSRAGSAHVLLQSLDGLVGRPIDPNDRERVGVDATDASKEERDHRRAGDQQDHQRAHYHTLQECCPYDGRGGGGAVRQRGRKTIERKWNSAKREGRRKGHGGSHRGGK